MNWDMTHNLCPFMSLCAPAPRLASNNPLTNLSHICNVMPYTFTFSDILAILKKYLNIKI